VNEKYLSNLCLGSGLSYPVEHPRAKVTRQAEIELEKAYLDIADKYELTTGERLRVLSNALHNGLSNIAKYAIRHERHGSGDKPGDLE
jgi:hypothetical protein